MSAFESITVYLDRMQQRLKISMKNGEPDFVSLVAEVGERALGLYGDVLGFARARRHVT